jgi:signal peptidase I
MEPTVIEGDRIIVDLTYCRQTRPKPIDVFVIQNDGGDTVEGKDGLIAMNGGSLKEPYVDIGDVVDLHLKESQFAPLTVAPRELRLLGDNRDNTIDGRSAEFALITEDNFAGKVFYVVRQPQ